MDLDHQDDGMDLDPEPNMLPDLDYLALGQHIPINENFAQEVGLGDDDFFGQDEDGMELDPDRPHVEHVHEHVHVHVHVLEPRD